MRKLTYNNIIKKWLNTKNNIKIQTLQRYESIIHNHIENDIGKLNINKINFNVLNEYLEHLKQQNLSISTLKNILYIMKSTIYYSFQNHYLNYFDIEFLRIKGHYKSPFVLNKKEQIIIENYLKENINVKSLSLLLCLYTGIRLGEVCGLQWKDFDFYNNSLEIKRTIIRIKTNNKTKLICSSPKSIKSYRVIPIPEFIMKEIKKLFYNHLNDYFLSQSGKIYDPRLLESYYKNILRKCNIPYHKFHTLRHTFATRSIESKMDIKTLSEILGHSSIEMTLKLYVHPTYELKKHSIEHLVSYMMNE